MIKYLTTGRFADAMTWGGTGCAITLWGLQLSDWGVIASFVVTLLGFIMNLVFKARADRRAIEEHKARIRELQRGNTRLRRRAKARSKRA